MWVNAKMNALVNKQKPPQHDLVDYMGITSLVSGLSSGIGHTISTSDRCNVNAA